MVDLTLCGTVMAKKQAASKASGKTNPAHLRMGTHSLEDLRTGVAELKELSARLMALIVRADELGLTEIPVDGTTKLTRGKELIKQFIRGVDVSLLKEAYSREG